MMLKLTPKKAVLGCGFIVLAVLSALAVFAYGTYQKVTVHSNATPTPQPSPIVEEPGFHHQKPYGVVLLGYGGGGHQGGKLTDSMIVAEVVPKQKMIFLLSLPRDIWVSFPVNGSEESYWKINAAYAIGSDDRGYPHKLTQYTGEAGGGELAKYAIQKVTGIPIDKFVTIDFAGFKKSIDVLGGVTINVDRTFDDEWYPIEGKEQDTCQKTPEELAAVATFSATLLEQQFLCRYEHLHFDAGKQVMDGETALKYVRSRHSNQDGGDFNRAARQRNLLLAVKERIFSLNFFPKAIPFISKLSDDLRTDLTLSEMQEFIEYRDDLKAYQVVNIGLTDKDVFVDSKSANGQYILIPKQGLDHWQEVHDWIQDKMKESSSSATLSATVLKK